MSEETKVIRFRVAYFDSDVEPFTVTADNEQQEQAVETDRRFICWLTDWQEGERVNHE